MDPTLLAQEKAYLAQTLQILTQQIQLLQQQLSETKANLTNIRTELWEEANHLIYDLDDAVEYQQILTDYEIQTTYAKDSDSRLRMLQKMLDSPYFGRVDFRAEQTQRQTKVYIGLQSLIPEDDFLPRVYDWRAPICSLFYEHVPGAAAYDSPSGRIEGTMTLKRQYKVADGKLVYFFDSDIKIDDEILQRALSEHASGQLKVIVGSIQKEQNAAIRASAADNLLVFGAAGSGKTSVGMHRLAYHLYRNRNSLTAANLLIISNTDVYNSYIADVLPELGERDIPRITFQRLIREHLAAQQTGFDPCEQAEHLLKAPAEDIRTRSIAVKYSQDFLTYMDQMIGQMRLPFHAVRVQGHTLCTGEELEERFAHERSRYSPAVRLKRVSDYALKCIEDYFLRNETAIKERLAQRVLDSQDIHPLYERLLQENKERTRADIYAYASLDAYTLYRGILRQYVETRHLDSAISTTTAKRMDAATLHYEDALVLLYILFKTGGIEAMSQIRHVLIDEAQDLCPLQHAIIRLLAPSARFTILADTAQALFPQAHIQQQDVLKAQYGGSTMLLERSYRSTRQINELCTCILGYRNSEFFNREGALPQLIYADKPVEQIRRLLQSDVCKGSKTIGILTRTAAQAHSLHARLQRPDIACITKSTESFCTGTVIMPAVLTKGLEFDCVILPNVSADHYHSALDKRVLYLLCTRALHHLYLICPGQLTPLLADCQGHIQSVPAGADLP